MCEIEKTEKRELPRSRVVLRTAETEDHIGDIIIRRQTIPNKLLTFREVGKRPTTLPRPQTTVVKCIATDKRRVGFIAYPTRVCAAASSAVALQSSGHRRRVKKQALESLRTGRDRAGAAYSGQRQKSETKADNHGG